MALDYVRAGQNVRASTVNSIIDAVKGTQTPSPDLDYTTTPRGTQLSLPSRFGAKNRPLNCYLETSPYILSSWPFSQITLGPRIEDCLNTIQLHNADGTTSTPISAAVVFANSEDCPIGNEVSGYMLSSSDFGQDKAAGAAGWVQTKIEYANGNPPVKAELWAWQKPQKMVAVFTNVESELSIKEALSAAMVDCDSGVEDELSTLGRVGSWNLASSTSLSVVNHGVSSDVPTHALVEHRGIIDVYESGLDQKVVLKAQLFCYETELSGDQVKSSKWAWKVWLGEGTEYDQSTHYAHGGGVTVGGNEVLFEADEFDPQNPDFTDGQKFHEDSILVGDIEVEKDEPLESELWLELTNDQELVAVKGEFTTEPEGSEGGADTDGLVRRKVFVAKVSGFVPRPSVQELDFAPTECISCGTFGHETEGYPLLDSYFGNSELCAMSLDWTTRSGDSSPTETTVAQLHRFDELDTVSPLSTDHIVIRRVSDDGKEAEINYTPLSVIEVIPPDTDEPTSDLSSIQIYTNLSDVQVLEIFDFHNKENGISAELSDAAQWYEFIVRDGDHVAYVTLSGNALSDIIPDTMDQGGQKSIDWLSGEEGRVIQLYKFNEDGLSDKIHTDIVANDDAQDILPNEYEFVVRKGGPGGEIDYVQAELSVQHEELSVDSQGSTGQKSVAYLDQDEKVLQLYKFDQNGTTVPKVTLTSADTSLLPPDKEFLIRKKVDGKWVLDYAPVSATVSVDIPVSSSVSVDYDVTGGEQRSLEWTESEGREYLQLYNMDWPGIQLPVAEIQMSSVGARPILPSRYEFVLREGGFEQGKITYANLSAVIPDLSVLSGMTISGDANSTSTSSVQTISSTNPSRVHQLFRFNEGENRHYTDCSVYFDDTNAQHYLVGCNVSFLVRKESANGQLYLDYENISLAQCHEKLDSSYTNGCSLQYTTYDNMGQNEQVMELFDFGCGTASQLVTSADISSSQYNGILYRKTDEFGHFVLKYMQFDSLDELAKKYIGDSQLLQPPHNPYNYSTNVEWDQHDGKYFVELYNFRSGAETATVDVHTDGCAYYWPQNSKTTSNYDYVLVKHVDGQGNATLQYKQLVVQMPNIDVNSITSEIHDIDEDLDDIWEHINDLSGQLSGLSGLSGDYWESGGDSSTCYGSDIGNSQGASVIDLDDLELNGGFWATSQGFGVGDSLDVTNDASIHGCAEIDQDLTVGGGITCTNDAYIQGCAEIDGMLTLNGGMLFASGDLNVNAGVNAGCATFGQVYINGGGANGFIQIGNTTLNEAQLSALLQLIS